MPQFDTFRMQGSPYIIMSELEPKNIELNLFQICNSLDSASALSFFQGY